MGRDNPLDDGQTQPKPDLPLTLAALAVRIKQKRQLSGRDALARVGNGHFDKGQTCFDAFAGNFLGYNRNVAAGWGELGGVGQQIHKHPLQFAAVPSNGGQSGRQIGNEREWVWGAEAGVFDASLEQRCKVQQLEIKNQRLGFRAGKLQQVRDEVERSLDVVLGSAHEFKQVRVIAGQDFFDEFKRTLDGCQRRTQVMDKHGRELGFDAIEFHKARIGGFDFGPALFGFPLRFFTRQKRLMEFFVGLLELSVEGF